MNQLQNIIADDVLNIFCDAYIKTFPDGITIGCPGAVGYCGKKIICWNYDILPNTTNNNSEITAIYMAVIMAQWHSQFYREINIFSDSKICVYGVKHWYQSWFQNVGPDGTLYSSTGAPVANQEVFKDIIRYMVMNNVRVNIYHQKGHVTSTAASLNAAMKVFEDSNKLHITPEQLRYICKGNDYIDLTTKDRLDRIKTSFGYGIRPDRVFESVINQEDLVKYTNLIRGT